MTEREGNTKIVRTYADIESVQKDDVVRLDIPGDLLVHVVRAVDKGASAFIADCGKTNHGVIAAQELGVPFFFRDDVEKDDATNANILIDEQVQQEDSNTQVFINLGFPKRLVKKYPLLPEISDGVGFARIEFVILEVVLGKHPIRYIAEQGPEVFVDQVYSHFNDAVREFKGKKFWIRTDDFSPKQLLTLEYGERYEDGSSDELVGFRGIARAIDEQWKDLGNFEKSLQGVSWIDLQFKAISRLARDYPETNIGIFAPMVHDVSEYRKWKRQAQDVLGDSADYGVMVEVPAIAGNGIRPFLDEQLIDFAIIGSNDLTALTLGIDRTDPRFGYLFDEENPQVLESMRQTVKLCKKRGVTTAIGGLAASRKSLMKKLYKAGIDVFSVNPSYRTISESRSHLSSLEKQN